MRFERAFGYIFAPLGSGAALAAYHIGSTAPPDLLVLGVVGATFGVAFAFTRNLLVVFPFAWWVASTMGTVAAGYTLDWTMVFVFGVIVAIQLGLIVAAARRRRPPHVRTSRSAGSS